MKQLFSKLCWLLTFLIGSHHLFAQQATNTVNYQVTYDAVTSRYIAWVVPNYGTPNSLNNTMTEKGGTAQFTIKAPASFSITNVQDINGSWDKSPVRLGPGNQTYTTPLDPAYSYFIIGKTPNEVDYGTFTTGVPVPLFSFTGNGCFGELFPLPPGDPFIAAADNDQNLNVANSFYSRSGTPAGVVTRHPSSSSRPLPVPQPSAPFYWLRLTHKFLPLIYRPVSAYWPTIPIMVHPPVLPM